MRCFDLDGLGQSLNGLEDQPKQKTLKVETSHGILLLAT